MITYQCPICQNRLEVDKPDDAPYRPFCSRRCKLIDLGRWLNEEYRITEEVPDPDNQPEGDGDESSSR